MTPFWHLTTLSCIPLCNPQARLKEQRIFREAASAAALRAEMRSQGYVRARCTDEARRVPQEH
jgi:hypothetical protein